MYKLQTIYKYTLFAWAMALLVCFASAPQANLLDKLEWKTEKHFGKATKEQLREEYGFIENPLLSKYFTDMGAGLSGVSHRTDIPYEFHILDTNEVNAFAAPGGFLFVTKGLLEEIDSDDELAAVMGHEVGHVAAHHGAKNIKKIPFLIAGMSILNSQAGETTARIGGMVLSLAQLHYSRVDEYQADELGVQYTYNSGYDPHAMTTFFEKLEKQHRTGDLTKLDVSLMSHPKTTSRMTRIAEYPEMNTDKPGPLVRIGDSYRQRFYFHNAQENYTKALAAEPTHIAALNGFALCSLELGDYMIAKEYFDKALALEPENQVAMNGLSSLQQAQAEVPEKPLPATTDPIAAKAAYDSLALAVMDLEDHISGLRVESDHVSEQAEFINQEFSRNLEEFSNTARNISEYDEDRVNVLYGASYVFSGLFDELSELERMSEEVVLLAEEGLKRGRIGLFRMDRGPVTPSMVHNATQLATTLREYEQNLAGIRGNVNESLKTSDSLYRESERAMDDLRDTLFTEDENASMVSLRTGSIIDNLNIANDRLTEMRTLTKRAQNDVDASGTAMRQSSLNLNTLVLDVNQDRIFRNMFARRFQLHSATLDQLMALGYGYGDAALIQSRVRERGDNLAAILTEDDGAKTIQKLLENPSANGNAGEDILLAFAEMDLEHLMQEQVALRLESASDETALAKPTTPQGERVSSDPDLLTALTMIQNDQADAAIELMHKRGEQKPATATSHKVLGLAYKYAGLYDEAREEFKNASKRFPEDPQCHFLWANTFQELERYDDALNEYRTTLSMNPDYGPAHLGVAYVQAMTGNIQEAENSYFEAIRLGAGKAAAHRNLGLLFYSQGRFYEALAEFESSLQQEPNQPELDKIASRLRG